MGEVAPQIQDDFDLQEGVLAELELQDRPENQVILPQSGRADWHDCRLDWKPLMSDHRRVFGDPCCCSSTPITGHRIGFA